MAYKEPHFTKEQSIAVRKALGVTIKSSKSNKPSTSNKKKKG